MSLIKRKPLLRGKVTSAGQRDNAETHEVLFEFQQEGGDLLLQSTSGRLDSYGSLIALRFDQDDLLEALEQSP
jgi:hypothetical protein